MQGCLPYGADSSLICLGDMDIGFCLGDKACYDTCRCVCRDDMERLMADMDAADVLVIAAPSYWGDVPGQFKAFIDRCTLYADTNPNPARPYLRPGKKCLGVALRTGTRPQECEQIISTIAHWCGHMGVQMSGSAYYCRISDKSDVDNLRGEISARAKEWFADIAAK